MAMPFVAPVPWEADAFYAQDGMTDNGLSLNQWPVGTGPYMMTEFVRDRRHVMKRNPNYRGEPYPCEGEAGDAKPASSTTAARPCPSSTRSYVTIEKEKVPRKEKFKQGYLDVPEIERPDMGRRLPSTTPATPTRCKKLYDERGFQFPLSTDITNWYLGFNMLDPVVGRGKTPEEQAKHRKLRQAISIAIDWEEGYGRIFQNKGGDRRAGPAAAGLFGSREGQGDFHDPVTHTVVERQGGAPTDRRRQALARRGRLPGRPRCGVGPAARSQLRLLAHRHAGVQVRDRLDGAAVRQDRHPARSARHRLQPVPGQDAQGQAPDLLRGWLADYPDAENFLFLLYGPNAKSMSQGENVANYENPEYDKLYSELKTLDDGPRKQEVIDKMVALVQQDAPWSFGYFPCGRPAFQQWVHNGKPSILIRDMARLPASIRRVRVRQTGRVEQADVVADRAARRADPPARLGCAARLPGPATRNRGAGAAAAGHRGTGPRRALSAPC